MDEAALSELNSRVERVSTLAEDAGQRSEAYAAAVAEKRRAQAEWARAQVALDEQHAGLAQDASDELVLEVARLQLQAADAARRNAAARAAAEADREELADVHASVDELRRGLAALPKSERAAGVDVGAAKTQLDRLLQEIAKGERRSTRKIDAVVGKIETYQQALRLEIESRSETETIVFKLTCVDDADVAKEHIVTIERVPVSGGEGKYVALSTAPRLPSFPALAAAFEQSQDVAVLLQEARAAFQALHKTVGQS